MKSPRHKYDLTYRNSRLHAHNAILASRCVSNSEVIIRQVVVRYQRDLSGTFLSTIVMKISIRSIRSIRSIIVSRNMAAENDLEIIANLVKSQRARNNSSSQN